MSGGSYGYLCYKDACDLFTCEDELTHMCNRLSGLGYADAAAKETIALLEEIRQAKNNIEEKASKLREVWHAVEWWDSFDSGEDEVNKALDNYKSK